jgi:hypothetical protein
MDHATVQNAVFFRVPDPGFIGETEVRFTVSLESYWSSHRSEFSVSSWCELWRVLLWIEGLIYVQHLECETMVVSVLRSVARRRLVEKEDLSACPTVNCSWRKTVITLYDLYVSIITSECVTQLIINPIIRTRTRLISGIHVTIYKFRACLCTYKLKTAEFYPHSIIDLH